MYAPYDPYSNPFTTPFSPYTRGFGGPNALPYTYSTKTYNPYLNYSALGFQPLVASPLVVNPYSNLLGTTVLQPSPVLGTSTLPYTGSVLGTSPLVNSLLI